MEEKYIQIIKEIANKYGKDKQVLQAVEEMSELTKELIKNINRNAENDKEIILEIADVQIMLCQISYLYGIDSDKLKGAIEYKLLRQKERIKNNERI